MIPFAVRLPDGGPEWGANWLWLKQVLRLPAEGDYPVASVPTMQALASVVNHGFTGLLGGMNATYTGALDALGCDYWVGDGGEGAVLLDALGRGLITLEEARRHPSWGTKEKETVEPCASICWDYYPPLYFRDVKGRLSSELVVERGCPNRCQFCAASWGTPWGRRPVPYPAAALGEKRSYTSPESTDPWSKYHPQYHRGYTVKEVLRSSHAALRLAKVWRLGVEGVTEERRDELGKGISNEALAEVLDRVVAASHHVIFYIIQFGDTLDEWVAFLRAIIRRRVTYRYLTIKITHFAPQPLTPLGGVSLRGLTQAPVEDIQREAYSLSYGVRIQGGAEGRRRSDFDAVLGRMRSLDDWRRWKETSKLTREQQLGIIGVERPYLLEGEANCKVKPPPKVAEVMTREELEKCVQEKIGCKWPSIYS